MTDRSLTTIAIRFASLLLFIEIFEKFGAYFFSIYNAVTIPLMEERLHISIDKFYYSGTFLVIANFLVSGILFFKAEWIAFKLISEDKTINIDVTPEKLIKVILLTTGIIWLARAIYLLPDLYDYIQMIIAKINDELFTKRVDFNPVYFILKILIALFFIFRVDRISSYLEKKMNTAKVTNLKDEES